MSLHFTLKARVRLTTTVSKTFPFPIRLQPIDNEVFSSYLRMDNAGYLWGGTKTHRRHCSDINGIIRLGSLEGITSISTPQTSWKIDGDDEGSTDTPSVVQEYANTDIRISLSGQDC
ncbi:hypothetical protein BC938DRAFT_480790 [Jimgerdemannia flammicorona]|uniref:Uncharacterized protein n=1 Tax=Jimgerdemannia flammicorona TaxID=994334 RepID=A0A433QHQ2_9FUNG|nr:hypothetical protein BC938DRAFT_480790 [Jimgerdemannia flammicorona]